MSILRLVSVALLVALPETALANLACAGDEVLTVELVTETEQKLFPDADGPYIRLRQTLSVSADGMEHVRQDITSRIVAGFLPDGGMSYRRQDKQAEIWSTASGTYHLIRHEEGEVYQRRSASNRKHDPSTPIQEAANGASDTVIAAGHRCSMSRRAVAPDGEMSVCNIRIFGRMRPMEADIRYGDGSRAVTRALSLRSYCAKRAMFKVPDLPWQ